MSIELCILASGSSGNCTVVRTPAGVFLIDCGIGPRTAAARLRGTGVGVHDVAAICLTHLDRDHFNANWISTMVRQRIRVFCAIDRVDDLIRYAEDDALAALVEPFNGEIFEPLSGVAISSLRLAHDNDGSHAFLVDGFTTRVGYATDLGRVPAELIERLCGVDLLAIESNYDPELQLTSGRPRFLQQRIMGGRGHLSNAQAMSAVRAVFDRCSRSGHRLPQHVVLLHRSQQCNCPRLVRELFSQDARIAPRLVLAEQHERTSWIAPKPRGEFIGEQLSLAFG
jgi:phosphoribosyl 1,2-cyclic phosphodiesterase